MVSSRVRVGRAKSPAMMMAWIILIFAGSRTVQAQEPEVVHNRFRAPARGAPELVQEVVIGLDGPEEQLFYRPSGLFLDDAGNVYVPDGSHHSILVFDREGTFLYQIGKEGSGPGEINSPSHAYLAWNGELVIPDMQSQRTSYFTKEGEFLRSRGMGGSNMRIVVGPAIGQIPTVSGEYIKPGPPVLPFMPEGMEGMDRGESMLIEVVDDSGAVIRSFGERWTHEDRHLANILNNISLGWSPQGHIAVAPTYFDEIQVYDAASGEVELRFDRGLAFNPREPSADLEEQQSPDGSEIRVMLTVNADQITLDVAFDREGRIWVLTYLTGENEREELEEEGDYAGLVRLEVFSPDGALLAGIPLEEPATRIEFGPGGELWLLDTDYSVSARRYRVVWPQNQ
ncbi:6-bladed beta-propeller [Gemmatimonadota bacterium]